MLLEDFYEVCSSKLIDTNTIEFKIEIHKNHDIFKGHFPNYPITPGVLMLQILKNCLEKHLQYTIVLISSSIIKFLAIVNPNEQTTLIYRMTLSEENNSIKVKNHTTFEDGTSVLKCNVTFVKK